MPIDTYAGTIYRDLGDARCQIESAIYNEDNGNTEAAAIEVASAIRTLQDALRKIQEL